MTSPPEREATLAGLIALIVAGDAYRLAAANVIGLGVADTHAISYLDSYGSMPQVELARHMGLTSGGLTGVVDRLERADIARRVPDPTDRRKSWIELTDNAHAIVGESLTWLVRAFDGVDEETLAVLAGALPALAANLTREAQRLRSVRRPPAGGSVASPTDGAQPPA